MPAVYPPTLEQVIKMRDQAKLSKAYRVVVDSDTMIVDSVTNFLIWDDANKLLYAIDANCALPTQFVAPYRIRSYPYDKIEYFIYEMEA